MFIRILLCANIETSIIFKSVCIIVILKTRNYRKAIVFVCATINLNQNNSAMVGASIIIDQHHLSNRIRYFILKDLIVKWDNPFFVREPTCLIPAWLYEW